MPLKDSAKEKARARMIAKVKQLYQDGQSIPQIMAITGLTRGMVYYWLLKAGVQPYTRDEWESKRRVQRMRKEGVKNVSH